MSAQFTLRGHLKGHNGWVTALATTVEDPSLVVSASRDKTILVWKIDPQNAVEEDAVNGPSFGTAVRSLHGHSHIVSDVAVSRDGKFALSSSWDKTLRLWNLTTGKTTKVFNGHTKDVLSVAFSPDNRHIVSAGRDNQIKIWNTVGECKYTLSENGHNDWVNCVRFSPALSANELQIVSCSVDKLVKVWNMENYKLTSNLVGHEGYVNCVAVSPDGSLCASGGKDGKIILWDLIEGQKLYELDAGDCIESIVFSPSRYWLCSSTTKSIKVWDLEKKKEIEEIIPAFPEMSKHATVPYAVSLAWTADGNTLLSGYTDNIIRAWGYTSTD
ncbi:hypothetical protein WA158_005386 [Blastocystis sp. Blastoise]